ncbi:MAG: pentapeptide repeat-containing protein [Planctomycetota bacterium]|nr:pentapeptide repeat-containing protein [Planctomycetota bacterium]MCX8039690.1 pentapeptide repeat-containing protein [Planctomycetota bacterium]MDW8372895.1 pentapeptide repeat-containing protein [Planctomycetota bacterium]
MTDAPHSPAASAGACGHRYRTERAPCPHPAAPESERCVWHNPSVDKRDAYVAAVVRAAAAQAQGDLAEARLAGLQAPGLALSGADLSGADLRDAVLSAAQLAKVDLRGAVLRRADLQGADLREADLSDADLSDANLGGANLAGAQLRGARLERTSLKGADLTKAQAAGADWRSVRWSRRTRAADAAGLPEDLAAALAGPEPADDDPAADDSRVWEAPPVHPSALRPAAVAASDLVAPGAAPAPVVVALPEPRRSWWPLAAAAAIAAIGTALAVWGWAQAQRAGEAPRLSAELAAVRAQADANLAEVRRLQAQLATADHALREARAQAAAAADDAALARAEAEDARRRWQAADAEAQRLRRADDRAALLALRLQDAERQLRAAHEEVYRQQRLGGILADGVAELSAEKERLERQARARIEDERRADALSAELALAKQELATLRAERANWQAQERLLREQLTASQAAIENYLARLAEADLGAVLGDAAASQPLLPVRAGAPLALGGDYLVHVRVDPAEQGFSVQMVAQRPHRAAQLPDVAIIFYDAEQRPLRRLTFGFPASAREQPFASAQARVASEVFPSFARVIVSPGFSPALSSR